VQIFNPTLFGGRAPTVESGFDVPSSYDSIPSSPNVDLPDVVKANIEKQKKEDQDRIDQLKKVSTTEGKRHKVTRNM
jgi:hypothetical protein